MAENNRTYLERQKNLEDVLLHNNIAAKNGARAGAFTGGLAVLLGNASVPKVAAVTALKSAVPGVLTFGGLVYGLSLMQTSQSYEGRVQGLAIASAAAIPSYLAVTKTAPLVFGKLYAGMALLAKGAYTSALPYLAAVTAGAYLGYSLLKGILKSIARLVIVGFKRPVVKTA